MIPVTLRVKKHRDQLRAFGFRPIQIWVPDTRLKGFREECERQSMIVKNDLQEKAILNWISSASDDNGWV